MKIDARLQATQTQRTARLLVYNGYYLEEGALFLWARPSLAEGNSIEPYRETRILAVSEPDRLSSARPLTLGVSHGT
jgi:hypothetical protein